LEEEEEEEEEESRSELVGQLVEQACDERLQLLDLEGVQSNLVKLFKTCVTTNIIIS
jgi:hypothetical protein